MSETDPSPATVPCGPPDTGCAECQTATPSGASFCSSCGRRLADDDTNAAADGDVIASASAATPPTGLPAVTAPGLTPPGSPVAADAPAPPPLAPAYWSATSTPTLRTRRRTTWVPWVAAAITFVMAVGVTTGVVLAQDDGGEAATSRSVDIPTTTTTATATRFSDSELVETYGDAVWRVEVEGCGVVGSGTAFAVGPRHLVTNAHVVGIDPSPTLRSRSGEILAGRVIGSSSAPDIAVIEVDTDLAPTLEWAPTDGLGEGQHLLALGYPVPATDFSATPGSIVSFQASGSVREAIRTDAAVDRGSSGGPALTDDGRVAGVVTLVLLNPAGIQFVPVVYTHDALGPYVESFISSPAPPAPDCSWVESGLPPAPDWYDDLPEIEGPPVEPPPVETPPIPEPPPTTQPPCPTGTPTATTTEFSASTYDPTYTPAYYDIVVRGTVTNNATAPIHVWDVNVEIIGPVGMTALGFTSTTVLGPGESTSFEATAFAESSIEPQPGGLTISWDWENVEHWACTR